MQTLGHLLIIHSFENLFYLFDVGNAYQLSQLIRTLLDPENMALGANVSVLRFLYEIRVNSIRVSYRVDYLIH